MPSRPCWAEISSRALEENYRFLRSLAPADADLLAMVKADAYGHSLSICAPAFVRAGAQWLGVTSVEEAQAARHACPGARVLVMSGIFRGQGGAAIESDLTPVVWDPWHLDEIEAAGRSTGAAPQSIPVHLEVDTGMSRQGVTLDDSGAHSLASLLERLTGSSPLRLEGVMTHLLAADEADGALTEAQLERLDAALDRIDELGHWAEWLSVGSSATLLAGQAGRIVELAARHGMKALIRPGLALYGVAPRFEPANPPQVDTAAAQLRPALAWKSRIVSVRQIPAGTLVGYNGTFLATETMRVALVALGYADGLDRRLSNRFSLLVHGRRAPIAGRISMDQTVLDVTGIPGVEPGDEVVVLGEQSAEMRSRRPAVITAGDHAAATGTIPWEIFTSIGARVRRTAV